jgi:ABC-type oligopeptide transport system substrate-binding subunit
MKKKWLNMGVATVLALLTLGATIAEAAGVLSIGRREDSTTFDPIKSAQNVDNWVFSNVFDVLIRVDKTGTKLEPGLAESWTISEDGLTYTFKIVTPSSRMARRSRRATRPSACCASATTRARSGPTATRSWTPRRPRMTGR